MGDPRVFVICDLYVGLLFLFFFPFRLCYDLSFEGMLCLVSLLPRAAWILVEL